MLHCADRRNLVSKLLFFVTQTNMPDVSMAQKIVKNWSPLPLPPHIYNAHHEIASIQQNIQGGEDVAYIIVECVKVTTTTSSLIQRCQSEQKRLVIYLYVSYLNS